MKINNKLLLKHKYDYMELSDRISKIRYLGNDVPIDLLLQALEVGSLAEIPDDELNNLLFGLDINKSESTGTSTPG
jgi:hypothetical protein